MNEEFFKNLTDLLMVNKYKHGVFSLDTCRILRIITRYHKCSTSN